MFISEPFLFSPSMAKKVESSEDILKEILLHVPVKPLLRFKTVSKRWRTLISEPHFCHSHTLRLYERFSRPFPSALMLSTTASKPSPLKCPIFPFKNDSSDSSNFRYVKVPRMNITIMQSSNGLLLLEGRTLKNPNDSLKVKHYVYNPTTNQLVVVNYPTKQFRSSVISLFLCFEPLKSSHYKIVSIRFRDFSNIDEIAKFFATASSLSDDPHYVANVYSSESGSWSDPVNFKAPIEFKTIYCNGGIYFINEGFAKYSQYFDVENLCFKKFPMPVGFLNNRFGKYFGESGGHVHVVLQSVVNFEIDVLELSEDHSGWSVKFHMKLDSMFDACPRLKLGDFLFMDVYCVVRQGEDDKESMLVFSINGMFFAYTFSSSSIKRLRSFNPFLSAGSPRCDVLHYYENLSSVSPS